MSCFSGYHTSILLTRCVLNQEKWCSCVCLILPLQDTPQPLQSIARREYAQAKFAMRKQLLNCHAQGEFAMRKQNCHALPFHSRDHDQERGCWAVAWVFVNPATNSSCTLLFMTLLLRQPMRYPACITPCTLLHTHHLQYVCEATCTTTSNIYIS